MRPRPASHDSSPLEGAIRSPLSARACLVEQALGFGKAGLPDLEHGHLGLMFNLRQADLAKDDDTTSLARRRFLL